LLASDTTSLTEGLEVAVPPFGFVALSVG
jgi:hypothetical protein